jgi:hypothetical protein
VDVRGRCPRGAALDTRDSTFSDAGKVGLWTKADSVTAFDGLTVAPAQ